MRHTAQQYAQALYASTHHRTDDELDEILERFMTRLESDGALYMRHSIAKAYRTLLMRRNLLPEVMIHTPQKLSEEAVRRLMAALDIPDDVTRKSTIDASMIGGVYVKYNNQLLDRSLARELSRLEESIINTTSNI